MSELNQLKVVGGHFAENGNAVFHVETNLGYLGKHQADELQAVLDSGVRWGWLDKKIDRLCLAALDNTKPVTQAAIAACVGAVVGLYGLVIIVLSN